MNWQRSIIGENRIDDAAPTMVDDSLYVISQCVAIDSKRLQDMGIRTVRATLISQEKPAIHDPERLGKVLMDIIYAMKSDMEPRVLEYYLRRADH